MASNKKAWLETNAAKVPVKGSLDYIPLESLCEVAFTIQNVSFEQSDFDTDKETVTVEFSYDQDEGTDLEGTEYKFRTTQTKIMAQMEQLSADDLPVGPVTIIETGQDRRYGTKYYAIGQTIPEIDALPTDNSYDMNGNLVRRATRSTRDEAAQQRMHIDLTEDAKRGRLEGRQLPSQVKSKRSLRG